MSEVLFVRVDGRGLAAAMKTMEGFSTRTPEQAMNTAAFFVSKSWSRNMDRATIGKIDSELATLTTPKLLKSGKPSKAKNPKKRFTGLVGTARDVPAVPLAKLIILARANLAGLKGGPGGTSNYNILTKNRYLLKPSDLAKGGLEDLVHVMISRRHRSVAFIAASVTTIIRALEPFVAPKYRRGAAKLPPGTRQLKGDGFGHAEAAQPGQAKVSALISLDVGLAGRKELSEKMNDAMWQHGPSALQSAVDEDAVRTVMFVTKDSWEECYRQCKAKGWVS